MCHYSKLHTEIKPRHFFLNAENVKLNCVKVMPQTKSASLEFKIMYLKKYQKIAYYWKNLNNVCIWYNTFYTCKF